MKRYTKKRIEWKITKKSKKVFGKQPSGWKNTKKAKSQIKCVILQFSVNSRQKHESLNKGKKWK